MHIRHKLFYLPMEKHINMKSHYGNEHEAIGVVEIKVYKIEWKKIEK